MYHLWTYKNGLQVTSVDDIIEVRDRFIEEHWEELVNGCVTLCSKHHAALHRVYGKSPALLTAPKQSRWVEKQRIKHSV